MQANNRMAKWETRLSLNIPGKVTTAKALRSRNADQAKILSLTLI